MTLAFVAAAWEHVDPAVGVHAHAHAVVAGVVGAHARGTRRLDDQAGADAEVASLGRGLLLNLAPVVVVQELQRPVQRLFVPAAVVARAGDGTVGKGVRGDEVAPPHVHRVHIEPRRDPVHHPLDDETGFRLPEAPVRAVGRLVGDHPLDLPLVVGDPVGAGHEHAGGDDGSQPAGGIGRADVGHDLVFHAEDGAVPAHRRLDVMGLLAGVNGAGHVLAPGLHPLDGTVRENGQQRHQDLLRIEGPLLPVAAADAPEIHVDLQVRERDGVLDQRSDDVPDLGGGPYAQRLAAGVVVGHHRPGLDGGAGEAAAVDLLLDDDVRLTKGGIDVAAGHPERQHDVVVPVLVETLGPRLQGRRRIHHRRQRVELHFHEIQRVLGDVPIRGHHRGHGLAHEPHLVPCQAIVIEELDGGVAALERIPALKRERRQRVDVAELPNLLAGQAGYHAGQLQRLGKIHLPDPRVGRRTPVHRHMQHLRQVDVEGVAGLPPENFRVFLAHDGSAHQRLARRGAHGVASLAFNRRAADCTASTTGRYPVQRHRFPMIPSRISSRDGSGFCASSA